MSASAADWRRIAEGLAAVVARAAADRCVCVGGGADEGTVGRPLAHPPRLLNDT